MAKQRSSLPEDRIGRYRELLTEEEAATLETAIQKSPPTAIRFNPLKIDPQHMADEFFRNKKWSLHPTPFCKDGYTLQSSPIPPGRTLEARLGYFYIQDAASMIPVELFEPVDASEPLILDLTAAPGGKSTHLASHFRDRGLLIANDGTSSRIPALTSALKTWGATNSAVINFPGEKMGLWFPSTFDCVLLDAPCSMENLHPGDRNKREIKLAERGRLAQRQVQLLLSALQACKPGGQVVYSTCTLAPEENEGVVDTVLHLTGNVVEITEAGTRLGIHAPGLTHAFDKTYSQETEKSLRLWPFRLGTSGFFSAHLRKVAPLPDQNKEQPTRPFIQTRLTPLAPKEQEFIRSFLLSNHGFDLHAILDEYRLTLSQFKQSVYAIPMRLNNDFAGLPINSCGLRLGDYTESGFEISLEWATRFGESITSGIEILTHEMLPYWARGEDLPLESAQTAQKGDIRVIKAENGFVVGTGRVSSRGIKNLLPRHLALKS